ncbi:hypothetical protein TorRG33x02_189740 [Trema orientale]|uniref:Uncharacterized protein n=1 Tax=Trema orientale TaxID=63057 RepID=A0A2P5EID6_TREOI|nr:hypothetical protein TorRG33x02_189740 [Trema orientale]
MVLVAVSERELREAGVLGALAMEITTTQQRDKAEEVKRAISFGEELISARGKMTRSLCYLGFVQSWRDWKRATGFVWCTELGWLWAVVSRGA